MTMEALVDSIMGDKPEVDGLDLTVAGAAAILARSSEECVIISEGSLIVGIVTPADIIQKVVAVNANPAEVYVRDIMSTPVITVNARSTIVKAAEVMSDYGVGKLPVVDEEGNLAGVVTSLHLVGWLAKLSSAQDEALGSLTKIREDADGGPYH
jgi:CBS domain-containing protein